VPPSEPAALPGPDAAAAPGGATAGAAQAGASAPNGRQVAAQVLVLSAIAILIGLLAGAGATLFVAAEHHLQHLLWTDLPEALGAEQAPAWLVVVLLVTGALITWGALRLPGGGGHTPLHGFGLDIGPRAIASVVLAAIGSLSFGAVLGPEAPLMAIGTALGALAFRDPQRPIRRVMMLVGAMAAVGAIFGNPLITAVLLLEMAIIAGPTVALPQVLLPALAGMASGYVLQVGFQDWSGLGEARLGLPGLQPYSTVQLVDLLVALPLAILVAALAMAARLGATRVAALAERAQLRTLVLAALVVAASALAVDAITGGGLELVLFSGQSAMPDYLALTSVGTALVVLVGKLVGYTVSLGAGFRGGAIFPAIAVGVVLATTASLLVEGTSTSALAAVAIAAATAAAMRLPFTALLLGVTLTYPAGGATTVLATIGTIVGLAARLAAEHHVPTLRPPAPATH
jgi:H+/Cl- antiporter ClcA